MVEIDCGKYRLYSPVTSRCILKDGTRAKDMRKAGYDLRRKGTCSGDIRTTLNGAKMCSKHARRIKNSNNNSNHKCVTNKELIRFLKRDRVRVQVVKKKQIVAQKKLIEKLKKNKAALKREVSNLKRKVNRSQNRISNLKSDINKQDKRISMLVSSRRTF